MEKTEKKKLKKNMFLIIFVIVLVLISANIVSITYMLTNKVSDYLSTREAKKKMDFFKEWSDDLEPYDENNYYMKVTQTFNGMGGTILEKYKKDDKELYIQKNKDGELYTIHYKDSEIVINASRRADGKLVADVYEYDPEEEKISSPSDIKPEKHYRLEYIDNLNIDEEKDYVDNWKVYTTGIKGKEVCIITSVVDAATYTEYVDKSTGLILYSGETRCTDYEYALYSIGKSGGIVSQETGYYYEFGQVTDEDVQKPDLSDFIIIE